MNKTARDLEMEIESIKKTIGENSGNEKFRNLNKFNRYKLHQQNTRGGRGSFWSAPATGQLELNLIRLSHGLQRTLPYPGAIACPGS